MKEAPPQLLGIIMAVAFLPECGLVGIRTSSSWLHTSQAAPKALPRLSLSSLQGSGATSAALAEQKCFLGLL